MCNGGGGGGGGGDSMDESAYDADPLTEGSIFDSRECRVLSLDSCLNSI